MPEALKIIPAAEKKIGEILIEKGIIRGDQLKRALQIQESDKSHIGKILVAEDYLHNRELHEAIAERFALEFVDLVKTPPDYKLLQLDARHEYFAMEAIPLSASGNWITIAATNIDAKIKRWAIASYPGKEIKFVITSPYDILHVIQQHFSQYNNDEARLKLWRQWPIYSARVLFRGAVPNIIMAVLIPAVLGFSIAIQGGFTSLVVLMNILFFSAISFKDILFLKGWRKNEVVTEEITEYPVYTILLPLFRETRTLPKLIEAMQNLDYPKSKLDIKFVVEADDIITINAIKSVRPPQYMEIIAVPFSLPRTKPKACNYALNFVRGEFVTIYDAEDNPDPGQLKAALAKFNQPGSNIACVQARLNYDNYRDNILTRWFALEYAIWFDSIIKGCERFKMPVFLGGTSNHIRVSILKEIGGWDAFNVTEDADLGMRLAQEGYLTATVDSLTCEEAPNTIGSWARQRTRWIKGFMQTYFVHMRNVRNLYRNIGMRGFVLLQFLIGIPIVVYIFTPILIAMTIIMSGREDLPRWAEMFCAFNLAFGVISHIVMCIMAAESAKKSNGARFFKSRMIFSALTFSLYGILLMFAAFRALYQLITAPHYWDKTEHGFAKTSN